MKKALFLTASFFFLLLIHTPIAFADETGFRFPTTCTTNGSSCNNMQFQDTLYNSWKSIYWALVTVAFTDFGVPDNAVIDDIQIKLRSRASPGGWGWIVLVSDDSGVTWFGPPLSCKYYPTDADACWTLGIWGSFNSINSPTFRWLNPGANLGRLFFVSGKDINSPTFRLKIEQSGGIKDFDIDTLLFNIRYHIAAPTPTPTPVPPFLDLPWDYQGQALSFSEAALAINSYFDHEYPLLSSGMGEPVQAENLTLGYDGKKPEGRNYSSHDGYDYGKSAGANLGDAVFAAADGTATRGDSSQCGACGNYILIDHGNGYQTRYFHMQDNDLIVKQGESKTVKMGDTIGKVGASGNVIPAGELGAHIHFMVVKDKDNDGNFDNNIPDGVVDPFGWQSKDPDPWPQYTFTQNNKTKTGATSTYLWKKQLDGIQQTIPVVGGQVSKGKYKIDFPPNAATSLFTVNVVPLGIAKPTNNLVSLGYTLDITATDLLGNAITSFLNAFTLTLDFSSLNTSRLDPASLSIYSSNDGVTWTKELTNIDFTNKTASAMLNHLTHFALMGQRLDTVAPTTTATMIGERGQNNWFSTDVTVSLDAKDNAGGLGVEYTLVKSDNGDWEAYKSPLLFTKEGLHEVLFYSVDADENIENVQSLSFGIDKTPPNVAIDAITSALWLQW